MKNNKLSETPSVSQPTQQWSAEDYRRSADVHEVAERIIKRVVSNVLSIAHTRHGLDETDGDPIDEKDFILDGLQVALGEDTGCLDPDDLSAENCEVLYVEKELREILQRAGLSGTLPNHTRNDILTRLEREWDNSPDSDAHVYRLLAKAFDAGAVMVRSCPKCERKKKRPKPL